MRASQLLGLLALLALSIGGCLEDLPSPSRIDDLRVLAIKADPPQVQPGEALTLEALVVDPEDRPRTLTWYWCLVPEASFGFFGGSSETSSSGGRGAGLDDPGSCEDLAKAGESYSGSLGTGESVPLIVPPDLFATQEALKIAYGLPEDLQLDPLLETAFLGIAGVNLTVTLVVETADGERVETFKRVNVGQPSPLPDNAPNRNPTDLTFYLSRADDLTTAPKTASPPTGRRCFLDEDAGLALTRDETWVIQPVNIPDPQEKYLLLLTGTTTDEPFELQTNEENYFYSYFSTVGSLDKSVSKASAKPETDWDIPADAAETAEVWIVVRDARGGTEWCASRIPVQ